MLNYTTKINPAKTASEIQALLAYHGARSVLMEYDDHGEIIALQPEVRRSKR
jgi:hypothetical protein